jgi:hypothetical protein
VTAARSWRRLSSRSGNSGRPRLRWAWWLIGSRASTAAGASTWVAAIDFRDGWTMGNDSRLEWLIAWMETSRWRRWILTGIALALLALITQTSVDFYSGQPPERRVPLIETATCHVDRGFAKVDAAASSVVVNEPFSIELQTSPVRGPSNDPQSSDTSTPVPGSCPVVASLSNGNGEVAVGDPEVSLDLAVGQPDWVVVAAAPGDHTLFISLAADDPCVRPCRVPEQIPVTFHVSPDAAHQQAHQALQHAAADLQVEVTQDDPLRVGVPGEITVTVRLDDLARLRDHLDELSIALSSPSNDIELPLYSQQSIDLNGQDAAISWTFIVRAPVAHDFAGFIDLVLRGSNGDWAVRAGYSDTVSMDVKERGWFQRIVIDNLAWIASLVGVVTAVFGFVLAVRKLRGQRDDPDPTTSDEEDDLLGV